MSEQFAPRSPAVRKWGFSQCLGDTEEGLGAIAAEAYTAKREQWSCGVGDRQGKPPSWGVGWTSFSGCRAVDVGRGLAGGAVDPVPSGLTKENSDPRLIEWATRIRIHVRGTSMNG